MPRFLPSFRKRHLSAFLLALAALVQAAPLLAQQVTVANTTATTVWQYSPACAVDDFPDVPARPFLVGLNQTVMWFAANSTGSYASVGAGSSPDILASLQRGTAASGPGCVSWLPLLSYADNTPASYDNRLWMVAPFTPDGRVIHALVHNEFHGEWAGGTSWCGQQTKSIYLPCNYWNIMSAASDDGGGSFRLRQAAPDINLPAIALGQPYQVPPQDPTPTLLPQGITAQSNILQIGRYYYVLVQQLPYQKAGTKPSPQSGVCLYRAPVSIVPGIPLTWSGWGGSGYTVAVPTNYPATDPMPLCQPVLPAPFRFSWSYNTILKQLIIIGQEQDLLTATTPNPVNTAGCPYATGAAGTADAAFVYMTATLDEATGQLSSTTPETCLLQINSMGNWQTNQSLTGQAYPSLLDPTSPQLRHGDRNFQYSGAQPYLYFTQLNPVGTGNPNGYGRDLVRLPLSVVGAPASR